MKHLPAILLMAAVLFASAPAQAAPILDFAVRVGCDFQQPERGLMDLHVLQGSTPLVLAMPKAGNTALTPDSDTSVRMIIGPTETGSIYAVRTNYAIAVGGYAIDWPTIGTNSSGQAWFYTLLFDREGKTYWSGSGALYIDASGYTGPDGVEWIEYTTPNTTWQNILGDDPSANAALKAYIESQLGSGEPLWIAASNSVVSGIASNAAAVAAVSGRVDTVESWGDHGEAGYITDFTDGGATNIQAGATDSYDAETRTLTWNTNAVPASSGGGTGTGWTNLTITGTGNAITNATAAGTTLTLERGTIEGGGGGGTPSTNAFAGLPSILVAEDWTWTNQIYAVGADTSVTNVAITLPDSGTNFTSVVIRKFSNLNQLRVMRGTNVVYTLYDDGSTRSYDWWPQYTNWYWRN